MRDSGLIMTSGMGFVPSSVSQQTYTSDDGSLDGRSVAPQGGPNDGSGRSWHEYFEDLHTQWVNDHPEKDEDEPPPEPVVLVQARNATQAEVDACGPIKALQSVAQSFLWDTKVGYCKSFTEGTYFKSGEQEGEKRPDVTLETMIFLARKQGKGTLKVNYIRKNEGKWTPDLRIIRGVDKLMSDAEVKALIKSD